PDELEVEAGALERMRAVLRQDLEERILLPVGEPVHRVGARRVVRAPVQEAETAAREEAGDAPDTRPAVDERRVVDADAERRQRHTRPLDVPRDELVERPPPRLGVDRRARDEDAVHAEDARHRIRRNAEEALRLPRRRDEADEKPLRLMLAREGVEEPSRRGTLFGEPVSPHPDLSGEVVSRRLERGARRLQRPSPPADERVEIEGP